MTPKDFESLRRKQIAAQKLQMLVASAATISDSEVSEGTTKEGLLQIKANEILNDWFDNIKGKAEIKILLDERA